MLATLSLQYADGVRNMYDFGDPSGLVEETALRRWVSALEIDSKT